MINTGLGFIVIIKYHPFSNEFERIKYYHYT